LVRAVAWRRSRAPWVSAVVGLHRGDFGRDWEREWIDKWKAENWPEGPNSDDEAIDRYLAYNEALEQARKTEDAPSGEYFYLDVIETISEEAVPVPRNILDAERDRRWIVNREAGAYELLA
jgi:hypothetical protein